MREDEQLREKADAMAIALNKLLTDLAKDGTAIEGFTAAWNAHLEYNHAVFNYELARLSVAPEPSFKETQAEMLREILSNWKDNQAVKRVGDSYESEDFFIAAELEKFTITRKKENN